MTKRSSVCLAVHLAVIFGLAAPALCEDWPTWRHDARRSGCTAEDLPKPLRLEWSRQLPQPQRIWLDAKSSGNDFVRSYEPAVVGQALLVPSMVTGSLTAYDVANGRELWQFWANGPIWMAPTARDGKLWLGSDDGFVYCLNAADGKLLWKRSLAPRRQTLWLRGQCVSAWPIRVAPEVVDGVLYCSSGLHQVTGLFYWALQADTGEVIWRNDRPQSEGGVGGYWAVAPPALACLDSPGKGLLLGMRIAPQRGQSEVVRNVLNRPPGNDNDVSDFTKSAPPHAIERMLPGMSACLQDGKTIYVSGTVGRSADRAVRAFDFDLSEPGASLKLARIWSVDKAGKPSDELQKVIRWSLSGNYVAKCKAGESIFAAEPSDKGKKAKLVRIEPPANGAQAAVSWEVESKADVETVLAAAGRLFVVMDDGQVLCYGDGGDGQAVEHKLVTEGPTRGGDEWSAQAAQILQACGGKRGHAVVVGLQDGRLVEELLAQSELRVLALERDAAKVQSLRKRLDATGLLGLGARAQVMRVDDLSLKTMPKLSVRLVASEDPSAMGLSDPAAVAELHAMLRPFDGAACLKLAKAQQDTLRSAAASLDGAAKVEQVGELTVLRRLGAPEGGNITHYPGLDCSDSFSTGNAGVGLFNSITWLDQDARFELQAGQEATGSPSVLLDGRVAKLRRDRNVVTMEAIDIYSGVLEWQTTIEAKISDTTWNSTPLVADGGFVYIGTDEGVIRLDMRTGQADKSSTLLAGSAVRSMKLADGVLVAHDGENLSAFELASGRTLWQRPLPAALARPWHVLAGGRVYCIEGLPLRPLPPSNRNATQPSYVKQARPAVLALDLRSGKEIWRFDCGDMTLSTFQKGANRPYPVGRVQYAPSADMVIARIMLETQVKDRSGKEVDQPVFLNIGIRAKDGQKVWTAQTPVPVGQIWTSNYSYLVMTGDLAVDSKAEGIDLKTGQVLNCGSLMNCSQKAAIGGLIRWEGQALDASDGIRYSQGFSRTGCIFCWFPGAGVVAKLDGMGWYCGCGQLRHLAAGLATEPDRPIERWESEEPRPMLVSDQGVIEPSDGSLVEHLALNCGGHGRLRLNGTLWRGLSDDSVKSIKPFRVGARFNQHVAWLDCDQANILATGLLGLEALKVRIGDGTDRSYTVRLHFMEPRDILGPCGDGLRVFGVSLQGVEVLKELDVFKSAGGTNRPLVKEFKGVKAKDVLAVGLKASSGQTLLCGLEAILEK